MVGERGREVKEFIEDDLGEAGLAKTVLVVATGDESPLMRRQAAYTTLAVAEYFRDQGQDVLCMIDSITRFAMAQREIGLAMGEPPTTKGYTPSVFTLLPKLLERAGTTAGPGAITGLYTVLVEGDDTNEPVADALRAILDGHICLSRDLSMQCHFPAIDVLASISRVMDDVVDAGHREAARQLKSILATYKQSEDLINIGAYVAGSNAKIDLSIKMMDSIRRYLIQDTLEHADFDESEQGLDQLLKESEQLAFDIQNQHEAKP